MSALEIRDAVESALRAEGVTIGKYIIQGQPPVDAINIGATAEGTVVSGLEVLISSSPEMEELGGFAFPGAPSFHRVRLINWDDEPDILEQASNAIARHLWPFHEFPALVEATTDNPEQVNFSLYPPNA